MNLHNILTKGTTQLRLAVIGAPTSGKTYLLSDLIHALDIIGFEPETLPLDYPHSSFGSFFHDISAFTTDDTLQHASFRGTEIYACRQENHYGARLRHPNTRRRLDIEFLNIPGEVFQDGSQGDHKGAQHRLKLFFELRKAISRTGRRFAVATYTNPAGRARHIVEPLPEDAPTATNRHSTAPSQLPTARNYNYMEWGEIYAELAEDQYTRQPKVNIVSGRHIIDHFFDYLPDSVLLSIRDLWRNIGTPQRLDYADFDAHSVLRHFYFMEYCRQASDIILCDRLFTPADNTGTAFNYEDMTETLGHYYMLPGAHHPNIYMAFRGADIIMQQTATQTALAAAATANADPRQRRTAAYSLFTRSLFARLAGQDAEGVDTDAAERPTAIGSRLTDHLRTRLGRDTGHAFWRLLAMSEPHAEIRHPSTWWPALRRQLHHGPDLTRQQDTLPIPHHVYFTATPIDDDFRVYVNDPDDASQFLHTDTDGSLRSFHIETDVKGRRHFCFGTFQLMTDVLSNNAYSI